MKRKCNLKYRKIKMLTKKIYVVAPANGTNNYIAMATRDAV